MYTQGKFILLLGKGMYTITSWKRNLYPCKDVGTSSEMYVLFNKLPGSCGQTTKYMKQL